VKIFHFRESAPEYPDLRDRGRQVFKIGSVIFDGSSFIIEPVDMREVTGGIIAIQRYLSHTSTEWSHDDSINRSSDRISSSQYEEALAITSDILSKSENHTGALMNRAVALVYSGKPIEGLNTALRVVEIEPNCPQFALSASELALASDLPGVALETLSNSLARWKYHYPVWRKLTETVIKYDLCERVEPLIDVGFAAAEDKDLQLSVQASRAHNENFRATMARAYEAQQARNWPNALELCREAITTSKNNRFALLNEQICKFHLGMRDTSTENLVTTIHKIQGRALHILLQ
jgi:tetratricopeptide (TPR) repeat protein